jgi:L-asparaginase II
MQDIEAGIVYRGWVPESHHRARVAVTDPVGMLRLSIGVPDFPTLPRSALKPFQAIAMVEQGLDTDGAELVLAAASHLGEPIHIEGVERILAGAGLGPADLLNTVDYPIDEASRVAWIASGRGKESLAHNCSGKHASMLRTCRRAGWPTEDYRDPGHPLQRAIREAINDYCGVVGEPVTDGCTAPAFASTLPGLARGFGRWAAAKEGAARKVADAYRAFPEYASGTNDPTVALHRSVPGLVAKVGAEGVIGVGLPDGTGIAVKMSDGMGRGRFYVAAAVLNALGRTVEGIQPEIVVSPELLEALEQLG